MSKDTTPYSELTESPAFRSQRVSTPPIRDHRPHIPDVLCDTSLSWEARGMMAYMLTIRERPSMEELMAAGPAKRDATRSIMKELIAAGYVSRELRHDGDGTFFYSTWLKWRDYDLEYEAERLGER